MMFEEKRTVNKYSRQGWCLAAALSIPPVLFIAYLSCQYEPSHSLLGLFLVEWLFVLVAWRRLCPWLGQRSVFFAAVPFLLCFFAATILVRESVSTYGAVWDWSDQWRYLNQAKKVVHALHLGGWSFGEAWAEASHQFFGGWTLAGWPFVLGLVASFVRSNPSFELLHAVALSLNATFITLTLAFVYSLLGEPAKRHPWIVLLCFILLIGDPLAYAAESRKESMLQLSLMITFAFCFKGMGLKSFPWLALGVLGIFGVATTRVVYLLLIFFISYWINMDRLRIGSITRVVLALVIIAIFGGTLLEFQIRGHTFGSRLILHPVQAEYGPGMMIYNIPLVGPVLYYIFAPFPPLPWKIYSYDNIARTLIRGAGSVAWFFSFCYVVKCFINKGSFFLKNNLFMGALVMFCGIFIATVLVGDDPRYKQTANFYLAIMLFLTWYDRRGLV